MSGAGQIERAVLLQVLDQHPAQVAVGELVRVLESEAIDRTAIEQAIGALTKAGLLDCDDAGFVAASRSAVYLSELLTI